MKSIFGSLILILALWSATPAQTSKRRRTVRRPTVPTSQAQPFAQPTPASTPVRPPAAHVPLVMVNGQTLTTADLEPALRQELESLDEKIASARRSVLDLKIKTTLPPGEDKQTQT